VCLYSRLSLLILHASLMHCTILSSVACWVCSIFLHYLINGTILGSVLDKKNVFWFSLQLLYKTFLIPRRTERDMIKNVFWFLCKVPLVIVRFLWNLNFPDRFSKNPKISWKSIKWEPSCSVKTNIQTWRS